MFFINIKRGKEQNVTNCFVIRFISRKLYTIAHMSEEMSQLVIQAKAGNTQAFGQLYNHFVQRIYRFVYFLLQDRTHAEDITQETFLRAWKSLGTFSTKGGSFQAFLFAIARNLVTDLRRKKQSVSIDTIIEPPAKDDIEEEFFKEEQARRLRTVLQRLQPFEQDIVVLRFFEEFSFAEVAKAVGMTEGAVRVRIHRILKTLKVFLEGKI